MNSSLADHPASSLVPLPRAAKVLLRPALLAAQPRLAKWHRPRCQPGQATLASTTDTGEPSTLAPTHSPLLRSGEREIRPGVYEGHWSWRGYTVRYQRCGSSGPAVLCVHGFGGNCDHWRKNLPELGCTCRAYAIDLLGYGYSSKPDPRGQAPNAIYNFENWGRQLRDFISEVIGEPAVVTSNSVGGLAALQAAIEDPSLVPAVQVINISLRMLHVDKQPAWLRPFVRFLQQALRTGALGPAFFGQVATRRGVASVLKQCYRDASAVTEELVDVILIPGLQPGAVHVFLDFLSYSSGPLPEAQLAACPVPVSVVWGEADPWERVEWGRDLAKSDSVEEFVSLPGVGHCPQDEAPHLVNPLILKFVQRHATVAPLAAAT